MLTGFPSRRSYGGSCHHSDRQDPVDAILREQSCLSRLHDSREPATLTSTQALQACLHPYHLSLRQQKRREEAHQKAEVFKDTTNLSRFNACGVRALDGSWEEGG